jgi:hypothetical protein
MCTELKQPRLKKGTCFDHGQAEQQYKLCVHSVLVMFLSQLQCKSTQHNLSWCDHIIGLYRVTESAVAW